MKYKSILIVVLFLIGLSYSLKTCGKVSELADNPRLTINDIQPLYADKIKSILESMQYDANEFRYSEFRMKSELFETIGRSVIKYNAYKSEEYWFVITLCQDDARLAKFTDMRVISTEIDGSIENALNECLDRQFYEKKAREILPIFFPELDIKKYQLFYYTDKDLSFCKKFNDYLSCERIDLYFTREGRLETICSTLSSEANPSMIVNVSREMAKELSRKFLTKKENIMKEEIEYIDTLFKQFYVPHFLDIKRPIVVNSVFSHLPAVQKADLVRLAWVIQVNNKSGRWPSHFQIWVDTENGDILGGYKPLAPM